VPAHADCQAQPADADDAPFQEELERLSASNTSSSAPSGLAPADDELAAAPPDQACDASETCEDGAVAVQPAEAIAAASAAHASAPCAPASPDGEATAGTPEAGTLATPCTVHLADTSASALCTGLGTSDDSESVVAMLESAQLKAEEFSEAEALEAQVKVENLEAHVQTLNQRRVSLEAERRSVWRVDLPKREKLDKAMKALRTELNETMNDLAIATDTSTRTSELAVSQRSSSASFTASRRESHGCALDDLDAMEAGVQAHATPPSTSKGSPLRAASAPDADAHDRLRCAFDQFDVDADGQLSKRELYRALEQLGLRLTPSQQLDIWKTFDRDHNGRVDWSEFRRVGASLIEIALLSSTASRVVGRFSSPSSPTSPAGKFARKPFSVSQLTDQASQSIQSVARQHSLDRLKSESRDRFQQRAAPSRPGAAALRRVPSDIDAARLIQGLVRRRSHERVAA